MSITVLNKALLGTTLALIACVSTVSVRASDGASDIRQQVVSFADLDVTSPRGSAILQQRIQAAAKRVCAVSAENRDLTEAARGRRCVRLAIEQAVFPPYLAASNGWKVTPSQVSH